MAALAVVYLVLQSFEQLIEAFILASLPFWALSVGSVFVFRRKHPEAVRVYRTPGYPFVPLLFVVAMTALVINSLAAHPEATLTSLGAIAAGIPLISCGGIAGGLSPTERRGALERGPSSRPGPACREFRLDFDLDVGRSAWVHSALSRAIRGSSDPRSEY